MRQRCFKIIGLLLLLVFTLFSLGQGKTLISNDEKTLSIEDQLIKGDLKHYQKFSRLTDSYFAYEDQPMEEKVTTDVYGFKGKSVKKAFLYSLIVPGSGEFYAGSKIKAALFFGVDVTLWALYFNYHGKGIDKEDEYQGFADQHWIEDQYRDWLRDSLKILPDANGVYSDTSKYKDPVTGDSTYLSHHLPDTKTDQYYEMVGKYEQFKFGWDDFPDNLDQLNRNFYLDLRRDSNNLLNKAKYSAMFSLANHILSAFDAAIAVKKYNKKGERFSQLELKMRLTESDDQIVPKLFMSMRF